jgi:hypothetical protein
MRKIIVFASLLIIISGCNREYNCSNDTLKLSFIGYTKANVDTLIVKKYAANTNFQQLQDSMVITRDTSGISQNNDTISFGVNSPNNIIQFGSDWQVFVPAIYKTVAISNIISPQQQGKCRTGNLDKVACVCYNNIQSLVQDGQTISYPARDTSFNGYHVYIHN